MTIVGFHASHEQVHPSALLTAVQSAKEAGFTAAISSDHFVPWRAQQGHSAFAFIAVFGAKVLPRLEVSAR